MRSHLSTKLDQQGHPPGRIVQMRRPRGRTTAAVAGSVLILIVCIFFALPSTVASAYGHGNLLNNPKFSGTRGSYSLNCTSSGCPEGNAAAADWQMFESPGGGFQYMTSDLVKSTAPEGGGNMLHVSAVSSDSGPNENGIALGSHSTYSAWVYPVVGGVSVCLGTIGIVRPPSVCTTTTTDGQWQHVTGTYGPATAADEFFVSAYFDPNTQTASTYPFYDFYVADVSVNQVAR